MMRRLALLALVLGLNGAVWTGPPRERYAPRRPPAGPLAVEVVPSARVPKRPPPPPAAPGAAILMYHKTGVFLDVNGSLWYPSNYWVSGLQLESELYYLWANGYPLVSIGDVVQYVRKTSTLPAGAVAITVDDGFQNNYRCALPVLLNRGVPAAFAIITDRVSETDALRQREAWDSIYPADYLIWPEVGALAAAGMTIESHSRTHPVLTSLNSSALTHEVSGSRAVLEGRLGQPVPLFVYPRGAYNRTVLDAVLAAGYEAALTLAPGTNCPGDDPLLLKRVFVPGGITLAQFSQLTSESSQPLFPGQAPLPGPQIVSVTAPPSAAVGTPFLLEVRSYNGAAPASRGYLTISFPDAPGGTADLSLAVANTDTPGAGIHWPGDLLWNRLGNQIPAIHPMVEFEDSDLYSDYARTMDYDYWRSGELHTSRVALTVWHPGTFRIWVRLLMVSADHDKARITPESGMWDQQDWPAFEYVVNVS
jgi:peptidoglycan/xylan/chitin deacetylase (PgdA/CDA1 family)